MQNRGDQSALVDHLNPVHRDEGCEDVRQGLEGVTLGKICAQGRLFQQVQMLDLLRDQAGNLAESTLEEEKQENVECEEAEILSKLCVVTLIAK